MEGIILWFNNYKGYGELETKDGDRYFLTSEDIKKLISQKILAGSKVKFDSSTKLLFGWPRATNVIELKTSKVKSKIAQSEISQ